MTRLVRLALLVVVIFVAFASGGSAAFAWSPQVTSFSCPQVDVFLSKEATPWALKVYQDNVLIYDKTTSASGNYFFTWRATDNAEHYFKLFVGNAANASDGKTVMAYGQDCGGTTGPAGPQGPAGPAGPQGSPGEAGGPGAAGATGLTGAQGPAGPAGAAGPVGPAGAPGPAGPVGSIGTAGPVGAKGLIGPAGKPGAPGAKGTPGKSIVGPKGAPGKPGPLGAKGVPGRPAKAVTLTPKQVCLRAPKAVWINGHCGFKGQG